MSTTPDPALARARAEAAEAKLKIAVSELERLSSERAVTDPNGILWEPLLKRELDARQKIARSALAAIRQTEEGTDG